MATQRRIRRPGIKKSDFNMTGTLTVPQELVLKNQSVGNTHIKDMQGTGRTLYHFLPLDGRTLFNFFKELNKFAFPFTNLDQNKLSAGETMSLQRAYLVYVVFDVLTGIPTTCVPVSTVAIGNSVAMSNFNFNQGNQVITKDTWTGSFKSNFNKASKFENQDVYWFDTRATILENVDFYATLQTTPYVAIGNAHLGLVVEGIGSILNLKTNA
jgi:hypothetical protein